MELEINQRDMQGIVVLDLKGRLTLGDECSLFRERVKNLLHDQRKSILLNLNDVTRVDSAGIGALVEGVILAAKDGGRLKLASVPRLLHTSLVVHRLIQAFDIYDNEQAGLASFG